MELEYLGGDDSIGVLNHHLKARTTHLQKIKLQTLYFIDPEGQA